MNTEADNTNITTYQYDLQGSMIKEQSTDLCRQYLYNDFHQCIQTDVIRGREEEAERFVQQNFYDGEGLRFALIENGSNTGFITDGWNNVTEFDGNGRVRKRIIRGMGIAASENIGESADTANAFTSSYHYYHGNERMDVEYITDESGKVVNSYAYDAFGSIISSKETIPNRYTYNGEAYDKATEQYYLRKRYYNPKLSRFIQEDEYRGDGLNLYAFCANNPMMYVDPSGYARTPKPYRSIYGKGDTISAINDAKSGINVSQSPNNSFVMLKGEYDASVNVLLNGHGLEGIWYRNDKPDFTPVSMFNVQVDNMPTYREGAGGSYDITRTAIANELIKSSGNINALIQNGTVSDYATAKTKKQVQNFLQDPIVKQHIANNNVGGLKTDIANFQSENKYTIHEVDTKNVQLVPTEVNSRFNHDGGISESKKCTK